MFKNRNKCDECPVKTKFEGSFEAYMEKRRAAREREVAQRAETIAWLNGEIDAVNKRLRAAAESVGILRWIHEGFVKFNEAPEWNIERIQGLDPEYRKTLFSTYAHALEDVIRALDPEGKTAPHIMRASAAPSESSESKEPQ